MKVPHSIYRLAQALRESAVDAGIHSVAARCDVVISLYWSRSRISGATCQWVIDMANDLEITA